MNNITNSILEAVDVSKRFAEGKPVVTVLESVRLSVSAGQTIAILGTSGSGKSTLLHLLGGLDKPSTGCVLLQGRDWEDLTPSQAGRARNMHLGFVYQFHHLLPEFTAVDNVAMPLFIRRMDAKVAREKASALLTRVGLSARLMHRPSELSGGERQRVAVARALVTEPDCILADEPTGNLDRSTAGEIFALLIELARTKDSAVVMVTHDRELAQQCDKQYQLCRGHLEAF